MIKQQQERPSLPPVTTPIDDLGQQERRRLMEEFWQAIASIGERNQDKDPKQILAAVTAIVEGVRQEQVERAPKASRRRAA